MTRKNANPPRTKTSERHVAIAVRWADERAVLVPHEGSLWPNGLGVTLLNQDRAVDISISDLHYLQKIADELRSLP